MRKSTLPLYMLAYLLFLVGAVLAFIENGSELAFWIMVMGIAIDLTLLILPIFGAASLKIQPQQAKPSLFWGFACRILAIALALSSIVVRFFSRIILFQIMLGSAILLYTISVFIWTKHVKK